MVEDLQSMVPLLTLSRSGTTVRWAAWPEAIRSEGKLYKPFRFVVVFDYLAESSAWKRVEIVLDHAVPFFTPFPSECSLTATLQIVTDRDHNRIIRRVVGALTFENDKIYFEPGGWSSRPERGRSSRPTPTSSRSPAPVYVDRLLQCCNDPACLDTFPQTA